MSTENERVRASLQNSTHEAVDSQTRSSSSPAISGAPSIAPESLTNALFQTLTVVVFVLLIGSFIYVFGFLLPRDTPKPTTGPVQIPLGDVWPVIGSLILVLIVFFMKLATVFAAHDLIMFVMLITAVAFLVSSWLSTAENKNNFEKIAFSLATFVFGFYAGGAIGGGPRPKLK